MNLDFCQLKTIPLFSTLKDDELEFLLAEHVSSSVDSHQNIIFEQDWGKTLFLIGNGLAKIRSITFDGEEVIYAIAGKGDVFGEMAGLKGENRSADVISLTAMNIYKFPEKKYIQLLNSSSSFSLQLARYQSIKLNHLNQRFSIQKGDAITRYLDAFAYIATKLSLNSSNDYLIPKPIQKEIASIAGLSRETASRTLTKLKTRAIIVESNDGLKIGNKDSLIKRGISY